MYLPCDSEPSDQGAVCLQTHQILKWSETKSKHTEVPFHIHLRNGGPVYHGLFFFIFLFCSLPLSLSLWYITFFNQTHPYQHFLTVMICFPKLVRLCYLWLENFLVKFAHWITDCMRTVFTHITMETTRLFSPLRSIKTLLFKGPIHNSVKRMNLTPVSFIWQ